MLRRHLSRAWEYNRFWQKERDGGSRVEPLDPIYADISFDDLPESSRMPQTRGETNRFKLSLKKSMVEAKRGKTIPAALVFARLRRKIREHELERQRIEDAGWEGHEYECEQAALALLKERGEKT